jgi:hypothetical protein
MSIDNCQVCDKRLDTDYIECQEDGTLLCGSCLDELENEQKVTGVDLAAGPDETIYTSRTDYRTERDRYKALAGELAEALKTAVKLVDTDAIRVRPTEAPLLMDALYLWNTALAKYEQEQEKGA